MKKRIWLVLSIFVLLIAMTVPVAANNIVDLNSTPNATLNLNKTSTGETAIINTNDFYTLNNEIVDLREYIDNFNKVPSDTYFYVSGTEGSNTIERYKLIDGSYYACDENGIVADGAVPSSVDESTLCVYSGLNASNLSAGAVGFLDKSMILGDGSDNAAYEESGYRAGYTQGIADGLSNVNVQYTYHEHTGDSTIGGGCYTTEETTPVYDDCYHDYDHYIEEYNGLGDLCKYVYYRTGSICGKTTSGINSPLSQISHKEIVDYKITGFSLGCGKTEDTIESATIIY